MASLEKLIKSLDALKIATNNEGSTGDKLEESSPLASSVYRRTHSRNSNSLSAKEKVNHCNTIADLICNPSLSSGQDFNRLVGVTVETYLFYCGDDEPDVRTKASECLNRLIKCLLDTHSSRILVELFKEMKRHNRQVSLKAAIIRFSECCHCVRPSKRRTYWSNLHSCLIELAKCTDQESTQETLSNCLDKIMSVFGRFSLDQELLSLIHSFLPNLNHPSASIRRLTASSLVTCVESARHSTYLASSLMDSIISSAPGDEALSTGYILLLKHMVPLFDRFTDSSGDQEKVYTAFRKLYFMLQREENDSTTILHLLEALQSMLKCPSKFLIDYLTDDTREASLIDTLTQLICTRFLPRDTESESSRVSIKSVALSLIASCVLIHPSCFLLQLPESGRVWNLLEYSSHTDPQVKCQVTSLVANFIKAVLSTYETYNQFLSHHCSSDSISQAPFLEDLLSQYLHLNNSMHPVLIKTILISLQELIHLLTQQNECLPAVISVLREAVSLHNHQYWLVRLELINLLSTVPFIILIHYNSKCTSLQSEYLNNVLVRLLSDEDYRVRTAASNALVSGLHNLFSPGSLIRSDPVLSYAWNESQILCPSFSSSEWDKNDNFIFPFKMSYAVDSSIAENLEFVLNLLWESLICNLDSRNATAGILECLNCLIETYPATIYTKSWQCSLSTSCPRILFSLLTSNCDLSIRQILHSLLSHWLCGYIHITAVDGVSFTVNDIMIDHMKLLCDDLHLVTSVVTGKVMHVLSNSASKKHHSNNNGTSNGSSCSLNGKLGQILTSTYASYLVSTELTSNKFCKFISSILLSLSRLLEMIPIESKIDTLLNNIQSICHLAPVSALITVRQLLKSCFSMNFVSLIYLKDSTQILPHSCPCSLYDSCINQPIVKLRQMQHQCNVNSYWESEKKVKRRCERKIVSLLEKASNDSTITSNIKLFEPIVVKSLHTYAVTGNSQLQVAILQLVCQLIKVRVNYSLLDAEHTFIKFVQSQFEDSTSLEDPLAIREVFQLLTLLSHEKYLDSHVVPLSTCIQLFQSTLVNNSPLLVPAMESLVKDLFLFRTGEHNTDVDTQREMVLSIFLKIPLTPTSLELLLVACYCIKSEMKHEHTETWNRISKVIVDGLLQNVTYPLQCATRVPGNINKYHHQHQHHKNIQRHHYNDQLHLMYNFYRLWLSLSSHALPSISTVVSYKKPSLNILSLALVVYSQTDDETLLHWLIEQIPLVTDDAATFVLLHLINSTTFQRTASKRVKIPETSIISMRPLLALEWCHIILLSGIDCTSIWRDILDSECHTLLHVDMIKRGLILLLAEFASDDAEQLTWLMMNHVHSIVRWSDEPPVKDLIHSIYKKPSPSALFIQSLNTRCCDCKDASFLTKLLECVQYIHPTQSGSLVALLIEQIIVCRECRFYLSIRARAEKLTIERLQMIMSTNDADEMKSYFLPQDLKHLLQLLQQVPNSPVIPVMKSLISKMSAYYNDTDDNCQLFQWLQKASSSSSPLRDASWSQEAPLTVKYIACKHITHASPSAHVNEDTAEGADKLIERKQLKHQMEQFISNLPYTHESSDIRMNNFIINLLLTYAPVYRKYIRATVNSTESLNGDTLTCLMLYSHTLCVSYLNEWSIVILTEAFTSPSILSLLDDEQNTSHLYSIINNIYDYFIQNTLNDITRTTALPPIDKLTTLLDLLDTLDEPTRSTLYRLCVPLARLKCINSFMLIPPAVKAAGFNLPEKNTAANAPSYPIVPSEYLRDVKCLSQFILRICKLGCICKVQFEEIWMTFLGVISLVQMDTNYTDDADVTVITSLAIKSLTKLLLLSTASSKHVKSPSTSSTSSTDSSCIAISTATEIDVQSSLRFLLDLFHQIICAKPSPPVLSAIQRSYTRIFPLFFEKSQFEVSFITILDLYKQAALDEDEMQLQYLELGILKCSSVLHGLYNDRVYRCIENGLRSPVPSTRYNTLRGITLLLETTESVDESIASLTTEYISEHLNKGNTLVWKIAFIIAENNSKFANTLVSHAISVISGDDVIASVTERNVVLQSCRRLVECKILTENQVDSLTRVAIERLHSFSLIDESATFELLVMAIKTFGINIGGDDDASTGMEKVTILFDRLKYCTLDEGNVICEMLPQLLVKLFPMQDVLNKVIGEFLSGQQVWLHLLAQLMYRIFGQFSRNNNSNIEIVHEWVCLSLDSFGQLKPITLATWSLLSFLLAASTNTTLKLIFPCVRDTFARTQQHCHSTILTIVYAAFRQELTRHEDKVILDSTLRTILGNLKAP